VSQHEESRRAKCGPVIATSGYAASPGALTTHALIGAFLTGQALYRVRLK
jgi:hypothetical protein